MHTGGAHCFHTETEADEAMPGMTVAALITTTSDASSEPMRRLGRG